jgi:hypothetical protein
MEFLLHHKVIVPGKELAYDQRLTPLLLIEIDLVGATKTKDAKGRPIVSLTYLWQDVVLQVIMERVLNGQMPNKVF